MDAHVRKKAAFLKYAADLPFLGRDAYAFGGIVKYAAAYADKARIRLAQAGDHVDDRRLSRSGGTV